MKVSFGSTCTVHCPRPARQHECGNANAHVCANSGCGAAEATIRQDMDEWFQFSYSPVSSLIYQHRPNANREEGAFICLGTFIRDDHDIRIIKYKYTRDRRTDRRTASRKHHRNGSGPMLIYHRDMIQFLLFDLITVGEFTTQISRNVFNLLCRSVRELRMGGLSN